MYLTAPAPVPAQSPASPASRITATSAAPRYGSQAATESGEVLVSAVTRLQLHPSVLQHTNLKNNNVIEKSRPMMPTHLAPAVPLSWFTRLVMCAPILVGVSAKKI